MIVEEFFIIRAEGPSEGSKGEANPVVFTLYRLMWTKYPRHNQQRSISGQNTLINLHITWSWTGLCVARLALRATSSALSTPICH